MVHCWGDHFTIEVEGHECPAPLTLHNHFGRWHLLSLEGYTLNKFGVFAEYTTHLSAVNKVDIADALELQLPEHVYVRWLLGVESTAEVQRFMLRHLHSYPYRVWLHEGHYRRLHASAARFAEQLPATERASFMAQLKAFSPRCVIPPLFLAELDSVRALHARLHARLQRRRARAEARKA